MRGVVLCFVKFSLVDIDEWTLFERLVFIRFSMFFIRQIIPRECHIEHTDKTPIIQIANIADRDVAAIVEAFNGVWVPQRNTLMIPRELLPVDVEWLIYWHDGRRIVYKWRARPTNPKWPFCR